MFMYVLIICMYVNMQGQGQVGGGVQPPPPLDFKLMLCVQAVTTKVHPKFRKTRHEKQLSGYKQCYTYKNQSLEVSKYMNLALITCNKLDPLFYQKSFSVLYH